MSKYVQYKMGNNLRNKDKTMKHQIDGKFYQYSDAQQLHRFLKKLMVTWGTVIKLYRRGNTVIIDLFPSTSKLYSVIGLGIDIAEGNSRRLGFALNVVASQGVNNMPQIKISLHPSNDSWIWNVLLPPIEGDVPELHTLSDVVGYYENEVEVAPERLPILQRLKER